MADADRAAYHAAAVIAANHLVALMGQVERVAATAGLPLDAFAGLIRAASEDALALGPGAALTGPAARGDWETVERHRAAIAAMPAPPHRARRLRRHGGAGPLGSPSTPRWSSTARRRRRPSSPASCSFGAAAAAAAEQVA